jgi:hypothetical protein
LGHFEGQGLKTFKTTKTNTTSTKIVQLFCSNGKVKWFSGEKSVEITGNAQIELKFTESTEQTSERRAEKSAD